MKKLLYLLPVAILLFACNGERSKMEEEIVRLEKESMKDSINFTMDTAKQAKLATALLTYAEKFPQEEKADSFLLKAAQTYQAMNTKGVQAVDIYRKYILIYPGGKHVGTAAWAIGFVY